MDDAHDLNSVMDQAIEDDVISSRQAAQARSNVRAFAADMGVLCQQSTSDAETRHKSLRRRAAASEAS
jgi:hypothetical protein